MAAQIIIKIVITVLLLLAIFYVWTNQIDIQKTIMGPLKSIVKFKQSAKLDINFANVMAVRFVLPQNTQNGNFGFLLYDMKFVNSSSENITVKQILLRYRFDGVDHSVDLYVLQTGSTFDQSKSIVAHLGPANIILMNWNNIRSAIGEYKVLFPGAVLAGSAAFILHVKDADNLAKIKSFSLIGIDYSGNEFAQEFPVQDSWINKAKASWVENRTFEIDQAGKIQYSNC